MRNLEGRSKVELTFALFVGKASYGHVCKVFSVSTLPKISVYQLIGRVHGILLSFLSGIDLACMMQPLEPTVAEVASWSPPLLREVALLMQN